MFSLILKKYSLQKGARGVKILIWSKESAYSETYHYKSEETIKQKWGHLV